MYDAIVVGSRCAGSSTARLLARKGHQVLMVDRTHFPSDTVSTHCVTLGGVIQLRRWGLLDSVLATNVPFVPSFTLTIGPNEFNDPIPGEDGAGTVSPRRTVLDKVLVDAAVEAGAELREGITVTGLLRDDQGGVVGIVGRDENGKSVEERAALVIGADGTHSFVAKTTGAEVYDERPGHGSGHYAYFSGISADKVELSFNKGHFVGLFPTNDGQVCLFAGKDDAEFGDARGGDLDSVHAATVAVGNPRLGEWVRDATRESRFFAFRTIPGFFRKPWGVGWALVGDAGYHKDPVTGHGITDAFRDAELLANAVHAGLDGTSMTDALGRYQARRDELSRDVFETTQQIASLDWTEDSLLEIFMRFGAAVTTEAEQIAAFG
jgi:flavin-dependent dehydrogenase